MLNQSSSTAIVTAKKVDKSARRTSDNIDMIGQKLGKHLLETRNKSHINIRKRKFAFDILIQKKGNIMISAGLDTNSTNMLLHVSRNEEKNFYLKNITVYVPP